MEMHGKRQALRIQAHQAPEHLQGPPGQGPGRPRARVILLHQGKDLLPPGQAAGLQSDLKRSDDLRLLERPHPALHGPDAGPVRCKHTGHRFLCFRILDQGPVPDHRQVAAPADQEGRQAGQFAPTVTAPEPEDRDRCKHLP